MKQRITAALTAACLCASLCVSTGAAELPAQTQDTLTYAELDSSVRQGSSTYLMLEETIQSIQQINFNTMTNSIRNALNGIAKAQFMYTAYTTDANMMSNSYIISNMQSSYDSLKETMDDLQEGNIQDEYDATVRQLKNTQNQVAQGAESLYVAILEMQSTYAALERQHAALERSLEELRLRHDVGQVSDMTLRQAESGKASLESGMSTLAMNLSNCIYQLQSMTGMEMTGTLTLGEVPEITDEQIAAMNYEADKAKAKAANYDLYIADEDLEEAAETYKDSIKGYNPVQYQYKMAQHTYEAAKYTYQAAQESFELNFHTIYSAVADYRLALTAAEAALVSAEDTYATQQLKHQQGAISENAWLDAQDALAEARDTVTTAKRNLFTAYRTYIWAVEYGLMN